MAVAGGTGREELLEPFSSILFNPRPRTRPARQLLATPLIIELAEVLHSGIWDHHYSLVAENQLMAEKETTAEATADTCIKQSE